MDEYRFQVNLNWSRTQYFIVLNVAILGVATGLLRLDDRQLANGIGIGLYLAGAVCCLMALVAGRVQQSYYRQAKTHKARLEEALELGDLAIKTTPGMGGTARRIAKVTTFHTAIISLLLLLDLGGLTYSVLAEDDTDTCVARAHAAPPPLVRRAHDHPHPPRPSPDWLMPPASGCGFNNG